MKLSTAIAQVLGARGLYQGVSFGELLEIAARSEGGVTQRDMADFARERGLCRVDATLKVANQRFTFQRWSPMFEPAIDQPDGWSPTTDDGWRARFIDMLSRARQWHLNAVAWKSKAESAERLLRAQEARNRTLETLLSQEREKARDAYFLNHERTITDQTDEIRSLRGGAYNHKGAWTS